MVNANLNHLSFMVKTYSSMGRPGNPFDLSKLLMEHNRYSMALTSSSSNGKWISGISGISGESFFRFRFWKLGFWDWSSSMSGICRPGYLLGDDEDLKQIFFTYFAKLNNLFFNFSKKQKNFLFNEWVMTLQKDLKSFYLITLLNWESLFYYSTKLKKAFSFITSRK